MLSERSNHLLLTFDVPSYFRCAGTGLSLNMYAITSTMMPARAIIAESMGGSGSGLAAVTVRGSMKGITAEPSIQIPKIAVT
jgi:hypothetical protein